MRQRYIFCDQCHTCIRTDDGSYCQHYLTRGRTHNVESTMTIFRSHDGKVSVPWSPDSKCPKGFVREEVRGARAVRRLEKELDSKDLARHRHFQEKTERMMEPINRSIREGLKHQMRNARHPFEKQLAQAALDKMERGYGDRFEAGNHRD